MLVAALRRLKDCRDPLRSGMAIASVVPPLLVFLGRITLVGCGSPSDSVAAVATPAVLDSASAFPGG